MGLPNRKESRGELRKALFKAKTAFLMGGFFSMFINLLIGSSSSIICYKSMIGVVTKVEVVGNPFINWINLVLWFH